MCVGIKFQKFSKEKKQIQYMDTEFKFKLYGSKIWEIDMTLHLPTINSALILS